MTCFLLLFCTPQEEIEEDSDLSDYGDDVDGKKDALAEPCFMLIGEIFELRGSKPLGYYLMFYFSGYVVTHTHTIPLFLNQTCIYIHSFSKYFKGPRRYTMVGSEVTILRQVSSLYLWNCLRS